jgi:hypothetical protein
MLAQYASCCWGVFLTVLLLLLLLLLLQINSGPGSEAARLKAAGNEAFKARDWATAIRMYRSVAGAD